MRISINFNTLFSALALIISILALVVSFYEANLLKEQQKATIWPYLSVTLNYNSERFAILASNKGVGPAIVSSMQLRYRDRIFTSWNELLAHIYPDTTYGWDVMSVNELNGRVLKAGETVEIFSLPWDDGVRKIAQSIQDNASAKVCYCSVMDECWELQLGRDEVRTPVERLVYKMEFEQ